jgi:hypothetical protein
MQTNRLTQQDLKQFTGTDHWYKLPFFDGVIYTDGVKYLAENAKCYWLLQHIIIYLKLVKLKKYSEFYTVELDVIDYTATITFTDGNNTLIQKNIIEYTDFPIKGITKFFLQLADEEGNYCLMLTSEY